MLSKIFFLLILINQSLMAGISDVKVYKNENYLGKIKIYSFGEKDYFDSYEIFKKINGKTYWYSVSGKMLIQIKSHKIYMNKKSDEVKFDEDITDNISNVLLLRGGRIFVSKDLFLNPNFSKVVGLRVEYIKEENSLKFSENINISSIRYFSYKDKTRVVVYLEEPLEFTTSQMENGRYLISIINGSYPLPNENIKVNDSVVDGIDISQEGKSVKIKVSLTENFSDVEKFTLKDPDRIVFDFKYLDKKMSNRVDGLESAEIKTIEPEKGIVPSTVSAVLPDKINVEKSGKKLIVIDPGHGGKDPGGRCLFGAREKDLNLDVAKKLYELLSKNKNFDVIITRNSDIFIPLNERSEIANSKGADLFVSIHANAAKNRKEQGYEIYFLSEKATDPWASEVADYENSVVALEDDSKVYDSAALVLHSLARQEYINEGSRLAAFISKSYEKKTPFKNRGIKQAAFYVLRGTYAPGVLVEMGFMTNSYDQKKLNDSKVRKKIAESIYEGILEYAKEKKWFK